MAKKKTQTELQTGIAGIFDFDLQRKQESEWLVSHGFPDDLHRAVKIAVAELGDFATSHDVGEMPLDNIWELLQTCVDRRHWLANIERNHVNQNILQETSLNKPSYLGVRFHPGWTISRDGYQNEIAITAPQQYKIFQFIHAGGENGRTLHEVKSQPFYSSLRSEKNKIRALLIPLDLDFDEGHRLIHKDRSKS